MFKDFHDVFTWSYEEMDIIYPSTVQHEINTYENVKPLCYKLQPINLGKATIIKVVVD